jgi:outer membrane protein assembly factor BamD (BamD/ComL family)
MIKRHPTMIRMSRHAAFLSGAFASLLACAHAAPASFEAQRSAVAATIESQPESAIRDLLKAGIAENLPAPAVSLASEWMRRNIAKDSATLFQAARAAELSGEMKNAISYHQQALKIADPKSAEAGESITAVHTLLIHRLQDTISAYSFAQNEADRLSINPSFRQFDTWFLDEAVKRNDPTALVKRLNASIVAGVPADLLNAQYSKYFVWLLDAVDGFCDQPAKPLSQDLYDAVKDLCDVMTHSEEMKLRLDWAVSVKAYNLSRFGDQTKGKIGTRGKGKKPPAKKPGKKSVEGPVVEEKKLEAAEDVAPPIAEASALLEKFPHHALWVMIGWAGGGNGPHYRGDFKKYWPHETEAKMAPILAALSKLPPADASEILSAAEYGGYVGSPAVSELKSVQEYLQANPALMNSRNAPVVLGKEWHKLTPEEAQKLALSLAQSIHPSASAIRAIAAGGKDYDKVMATFLGSEVWRLGPKDLTHIWPDLLWKYCGQPGKFPKRDEWIEKTKAVAASLAAVDAKKEDPTDKRIAAFRNLWADYKSPQPKIPAVRPRLVAVLKFTPEVLPELLKDTHPEAQSLVRDAIAAGMEDGKGPLGGDGRANSVSSSVYDPWIKRMAQATYGGMDRFKQDKDRYKPHRLEPVLRAALAERLAQGKIEPWLAMAWINVQFPENNAEQVKLIQDLFKSPAWSELPFQVHHAAREWFGKDAMSPGQATWIDAANPVLVCKDLINLPKEADAAATATALTKAIEGLSKSPVFTEIQGLEKVAAISDAAFGDENVHMLCVGIIDKRIAIEPTPLFGNRIFEALGKRKDPADLLRASGYLWRHVAVHHRTHPAMLAMAESKLEANPSVSYAFANDGLGVIERHVQGHTWFNREADIPRLKSIRSKAAMKLGLVVIPVAADHPNYPVYQSQAEWLAGNEDSAWNLVHPNWEAFTKIHRELTVPYLMWVLDRTTYSRDDAGQEFLIKALIAWAGENNSSLTPPEKAGVDIAYGDIALQRGQLREAHEIYSRVQKNPAYEGLPARHQAALRRVRAERMAKNYDAALQTLADLEMERIPEIWTEVRFARAETRFDMEEFEDSKEDIDSILERDSNHPDARILLGKVQLRRKKLMEATEVEIGSAAGQTSLVPGENLKVTLSDPTLAVSGAGTETEVVVWATSGDKETFFLRQFGDEKTKFRGEIPTALGAPSPADGTLQVIGDDEVFYGYSDEFRRKMNLEDDKRGGPITIASDAVLMASARKLLTEAEQRAADMQEMMEKIGSKGNVSSAAANAQWAERSISGDADKSAEKTAAKRIDTIAKPGNPLHIRVVDPDRGRTSGIDELTVAASASSGDSVSSITLRETGNHTGVFEGTVPTTGAQAQALADSSEPGRSPNMVISPRTDYPAWKPVAAKGAIPTFTVDFNDNLPLGELTITSREPGAALKKFIVQTSMNASDWTNVGTWPVTPTAVTDPWKPSIMVVNEGPQKAHYGARSVYEIGDLRQHMSTGWLAHVPEMAIAKSVTGISDALPASILKDVKWKRGSYDNPAVVVRYNAWFHEKQQVRRRFALKLGAVPKSDIKADAKQLSEAAEFLIAVNGRVITSKEKGDLTGEVDLRPGIHRIEIWATGWVSNIGFGREVSLLSNLTDPNALAECPDSYFDPSQFPSALLDHRNNPATIEAAGAGEFRVKFAKDSQARMVRLLLVGHDGPVPALNKLSLTKPDGKPILPVQADFAELNKNDTLEILTGDKIFVRYVDDRFVTKAKQRHERLLSVSFTDALAEFADMEPRFDSRADEDRPYYEKLLRFAHDKPLSLAIHDVDMDATVQPDKVKVTIDTDAGALTFDAVETGDSTGIFKLVITPVTGPATGNQVQVAPGGMLTATYIDEENNRPGVPTKRVATIRHADFVTPKLVLSHSTVAPIEGGSSPQPLQHGFERLVEEAAATARAAKESVSPRWSHRQTMLPYEKAPEGGFQAVLGQEMLMAIVAPHLALGVESRIDVYVQSDSSRRAGGASQEAFDINAPGTVLLEGSLKEAQWVFGQWRTPLLPIYQKEFPTGLGENSESDRFLVSVPLVLGVLPSYGALTRQEFYELRRNAAKELGAEPMPDSISGLVVLPGDNVHIGFRYTDAAGATQWLTATTRAVSHPVLDIMEEEYRTPMTSAYVGENLYLRVVDASADTTDAPDVVQVLAQAKSGAKQAVELHETGPHTGIFKSQLMLSYASGAPQAPAPAPQEGDAEVPATPSDTGLAVVYGDTVAARYTDAQGVKTDTLMVTISKGADGTIEPFSKQYDDPQIAMRTQFSLAEAYLELAKRHRKLNELEAAALGFETAKQLLSKAMDQFTDPETRAHAEYLLGMLTMEDADVTEEVELKETRYRAALSRFLNITGTYPQAIHASKAQYQIATIYERLKEPEIAAQEYVKLAYKYPDSEFLATSMARLGTHFLKKASEYEAKAKPLLEKAKAEENKDAGFEGEALMKMAVAEYLKTATIFGRLQERFPSDPLAGQAGLRAGQAYMRAGKNQDAVEAFQRVIAEEGYDGKTIRAQAMYWAGMGYQALKQPLAAYSVFKRLTYDFPESEWAAFARGQLSQEGMLDLETKLEMQRLEGEK